MSDTEKPEQGQHPAPHQGRHHDHHHAPPASFDAVRTMAIESLLIEKGLISAEEVDTRHRDVRFRHRPDVRREGDCTRVGGASI